MRHFSIIALMFVLTASSSAQTPTKAWQIQFDFGGDWDDSRDIIVDSGGNYLVAGFQEPRGSPDLVAAIACFDTTGQQLWDWVDDEVPTWTHSIATAPGNGAYYVGIGRQSDAASVMKVSQNGNVIDEWRFGTQNQIAVASNDSVVVVMEYPSSSHAYVFNNQGTVLQDFSVAEYTGNPHITIDEHSLYSFYISGNMAATVKAFTLNGNFRWEKHLDNAIRVAGTVDDSGNVYAGITAFTDSGQVFVTAKYDSNGVEQWRRTWDSDPTPGTILVTWLDDIITYPGGGCVVLGSAVQNGNGSNENLTDFGAIAYDANGNTRWTIRDQAHSGWERNDLWAAAWDSSGYLVLLGSAFEQWDIAPYDHRYLILSKWQVTDTTTGIDPEPAQVPTQFTLHQNYPNPFNPSTTIAFELPEMVLTKLIVYNLLGKQVAELVNGVRIPGRHEVMFNGQNLPSGTYLYRLTTSTFTKTKKMLLLK